MLCTLGPNAKWNHILVRWKHHTWLVARTFAAEFILVKESVALEQIEDSHYEILSSYSSDNSLAVNNPHMTSKMYSHMQIIRDWKKFNLPFSSL